MNNTIKLFSFKGRLNRTRYLAYHFAIWLLATVPSILLAFAHKGFALGNTVTSVLALFFLVTAFIAALGVSIRRCHDVDKGGWFLLTLIIPILGFFFGLYLFLARGTEGDNRFGPPNPPNTFFVSLAAWLSVSLGLLVIVTAIVLPSFMTTLKHDLDNSPLSVRTQVIQEQIIYTQPSQPVKRQIRQVPRQSQ